MSTLKRLLLLALLSILVISCRKSDWKYLLNKYPKTVITEKNLPLSGLQEVPQKIVPAKGKMDVSYNKKTKMLTYSITWWDLSAAPVGAHIHGPAARGVNAGVKHNFTNEIPKTVSGKFTNSVLVDDVSIKLDSLLRGYYYINIHTPMNPAGEIRGQIEFEHP